MGWQAPTGTAKRVRYARCETQRFRGVWTVIFSSVRIFRRRAEEGVPRAGGEGMKEGVGRTHKDPPLGFRVLFFGAASHRYPEFHGRCRRDEVIDHSMVPIGTF